MCSTACIFEEGISDILVSILTSRFLKKLSGRWPGGKAHKGSTTAPLYIVWDIPEVVDPGLTDLYIIT
jgi:hypothetical protein